MTYEDNMYLMHYGVKNQKWGIRKYQNEDGSLTELGKQHYGIGDDKHSKKFVKLANASNYYGKAGAKAKKKLLKSEKMKELLSDKEINLKKEAYEKAKSELHKITKGEDYDGYSDDDNYGLSKKQFENIRSLSEKKTKAWNDFSNTVDKRVNDFIGDHAKQSMSKVQNGKQRFDDVNRWISVVAKAELDRTKTTKK